MCYNIHLQIDSHCPEMRALGGLLEAACKTPYNQQEFMMSKISQLSGKRFGRLVAIERDMSTQYKYICKCDCGTIKSIDGYHLINGKIRSCGCLKRDTTIARSTKHGKARSPLYTKWQDMKRRCYNQNRREYKHYGARGITVCDEWRNDFEAFEKWCLENGYDGKLSLDRIDNDGNYEIYFVRSSDTAKSWSKPNLNLSQTPMINDLYPWLCVDTNNIYVVWQAWVNNTWKIYFTKSQDEGMAENPVQ